MHYYSHSDISREEAVTMMRVTEVEKDKLSELNQLLKQRYAYSYILYIEHSISSLLIINIIFWTKR